MSRSALFRSALSRSALSRSALSRSALSRSALSRSALSRSALSRSALSRASRSTFSRASRSTFSRASRSTFSRASRSTFSRASRSGRSRSSRSDASCASRSARSLRMDSASFPRNDCDPLSIFADALSARLPRFDPPFRPPRDFFLPPPKINLRMPSLIASRQPPSPKLRLKIPIRRPMRNRRRAINRQGFLKNDLALKSGPNNGSWIRIRAISQQPLILHHH